MAWLPDVVPDQTIESAWGNTIRDRVVNPLANNAARTAAIPAPDAGQVVYLEDTKSVEVYNGTAWAAIIPTGIIWAFGGITAPAGFLLCDGAAVSRTTYAALFAVIASTWGPGDGSTTFNVPSLINRGLVGAGPAGFTPGQLVGNVDPSSVLVGTSGASPNVTGGANANHGHNFITAGGATSVGQNADHGHPMDHTHTAWGPQNGVNGNYHPVSAALHIIKT